MKGRITILASCLVLLLSGCTLFPLREGEQPLVRDEKGEAIVVKEIEVTKTPTEIVEEPLEQVAETPEQAEEPLEQVTESPEQVEEPLEQVAPPAEVDENEEEANEEETSDLVYCISPVNVREAGDTAANVIGELGTGDAVPKISQEGGWVEIIFEGQYGYVYMDYVSEIAPN